MLKPQVKKFVRDAFLVACGVVLCAFILIRVLSSLLMDVVFEAPLSSLGGRAYLLGSAVLMATAYSISGFLTGLFIAYFSKNKEVKLALFAAVIVAVYYSFKITSLLLRVASDIPSGLLPWRFLELALEMIFLVGFAALGAGIVRLIRRG